MAGDHKPHPILAGALAASALLLAAFRRGGGALVSARAAPARHGGERGRHADTPAEIPPRGWWDILKRTAQQISDDRILTEAAGITFYALLALFPAIAALISIYGLLADPVTINQHLQAMSGLLPGGGLEIIDEQVQRITAKGSATLGLGTVIGLATSLWSANQGMKAFVEALNVVYEEKEKRGFFRRLAVTMAFTLGSILFLVLAMLGVVAVPVVLNLVGLGWALEAVLQFARWPALLLVVGIFLACLYRYGPSREKAKWRWVSWGSAAAALGWLAVSAGFSWYVANFGKYNETYGSLGAAIGFMTWIWISATVVLAGAELDAEMERQTARDTTTGPERPMGSRGARMADEAAG